MTAYLFGAQDVSPDKAPVDLFLGLCTVFQNPTRSFIAFGHSGANGYGPLIFLLPEGGISCRLLSVVHSEL